MECNFSTINLTYKHPFVLRNRNRKLNLVFLVLFSNLNLVCPGLKLTGLKYCCSFSSSFSFTFVVACWSRGDLESTVTLRNTSGCWWHLVFSKEVTRFCRYGWSEPCSNVQTLTILRLVFWSHTWYVQCQGAAATFLHTGQTVTGYFIWLPSQVASFIFHWISFPANFQASYSSQETCPHNAGTMWMPSRLDSSESSAL